MGKRFRLYNDDTDEFIGEYDTADEACREFIDGVTYELVDTTKQ